MATKRMQKISVFTTTTVLSCARCKKEIEMRTPVATDGTDYWHADTCGPSESSEVHTVESPKTDTESKGD